MQVGVVSQVNTKHQQYHIREAVKDRAPIKENDDSVS